MLVVDFLLNYYIISIYKLWREVSEFIRIVTKNVYSVH